MEETALIDDSSFEERADFLDAADLVSWNVENSFFKEIQTKLTGRGAKLLVGPRGCGKTHQIRFAHSECLDDKSKPFSVYVSFGNYLSLEPRLSQSAAALRIFHTWVLCKLVIGVFRTGQVLELKTDIPLDIDRLEDFAAEVEKGVNDPSHDEVVRRLTIPVAVAYIDETAKLAGRKRSVLLLDDAALSLTPEYMIEFFEIFRSLKTNNISPKASVYPGTTEYGPRFHVGHDAEFVNCWLSVDDAAYPQFMNEILSSRLAKLVPDGVGALFRYAAFGNPRILISLVRTFTKSKASTVQAQFNDAIQERARQIEAEYRSLAKKLPQYKTIIEAGWRLFYRSVTDLSDANREIAPERQLLIGIEQDRTTILTKMMNFVREVGLLYDKGPIKHGDRDYDRYIPHVLFLVNQRAFSEKRGFSPATEALRIETGGSPKHPLRRSFQTLLKGVDIDSLRIDAPECQNCGTPRLSAEQRFCHQCGKPLVRPSTFEACLSVPIDELGLPEYQLRNLKKDTTIKTLRDIFMHTDPATELRKAWQVGPVRSGQIVEKTQRFIAEFLER